LKNQRLERQIWSKDLNEFFRSEYELIVAGFLTYANVNYVYEALSVAVGKKHYIPDFYLPDSGVLLEVKGLWMQGSKAKMKKLEKDRPDIPFLVVPWVLRKSILEYLNNGKNPIS